jgi:hypothetical protein
MAVADSDQKWVKVSAIADHFWIQCGIKDVIVVPIYKISSDVNEIRDLVRKYIMVD